MSIWAIADLHLSFGVPDKKMDVFGETWVNYQQKIEKNWREIVSSEDLVLLPGDISWAMTLDEAKIDFAWLESLPGTKVMIKGNHDYWWGSLSKVKAILPPSCHCIQHDAFEWKGVSIGGARLWDTQEYGFYTLPPDEAREKIYERELGRLEMSLKAMKEKVRLVMTHYPPLGSDLKDSRVSALLEKYGVEICIFGHLHNAPPGSLPFGTKNGITYLLTACDYLNFTPIKIK